MFKKVNWPGRLLPNNQSMQDHVE